MLVTLGGLRVLGGIRLLRRRFRNEQVAGHRQHRPGHRFGVQGTQAPEFSCQALAQLHSPIRHGHLSQLSALLCCKRPDQSRDARDWHSEALIASAAGRRSIWISPDCPLTAFRMTTKRHPVIPSGGNEDGTRLAAPDPSDRTGRTTPPHPGQSIRTRPQGT